MNQINLKLPVISAFSKILVKPLLYYSYFLQLFSASSCQNEEIALMSFHICLKKTY